MSKRVKILFLCTGNSCRSQMAEAWTRHLKGEVLEAYSAGTHPKGVDPRAVKVMGEVGIDISNYRSKSLEELKDLEFEYVVTLCSDAQDSCPVFPAKTRVLHVPFQDPPKLAQKARDAREALRYYRQVRDEIRAFVQRLPQVLLEDGEHQRER